MEREKNLIIGFLNEKISRSKRFGRGFSVAELVVCLGLLAIMSLAIVALILQLLRGSDKESHLAAGNVLAEQIMTERLQAIFSDSVPGLTKDQFFDTDSPPAAPLEGIVVLGTTEFTYQMSYQTIFNTGGVPVGGDVADTNRLKRVDIKVWWWTDDPDNPRAGHGYLRTTATRFVNEKMDFDV